MKIIFLDIDGVLNRWCFTKEKIPATGEVGIDPENFACFFNMLDKTDAKIVVCSTYRKSEKHRKYFEDYIAPKYTDRLIGYTPQIYAYDGDSEGCRHKEIELWLRENPDVSHWVVLDDEGYVVTSNIGKGIKPCIHSLEGFEDVHASEVLEFFKD